MEGESGESGGPSSQEPNSESAGVVLEHCVWGVEIEAVAVS